MNGKKQIIESVPNFSEGKDLDRIDKIVSAFRGKKGLKLLDYRSDADHNRLVVTVIGEPGSVKDAVVAAVGTAVELIDMRRHRGQHPRMGAVDVIPFIPVKDMDMAEAVAVSKNVAETIAHAYDLPVFLYEKSASRPERQSLAAIRQGQFEKMVEKLAHPQWKPDYGPARIHPTAGVTAVGARMPLVAFNVNLNTASMEIAGRIAEKVRHIDGGLRYCRAIGVALEDRGIVQVSMNMTDFTRTALYQAFELIRIEARRYGVGVAGSEIVGLVPMTALIDTAAYYLGLEDFTLSQILETRLLE